MDRLISLQAAIDAMYKMLHDCFLADDEELDAIIATLNDLPSAQPQSTMGQVNDTAQSTNDCISRRAAIDAPVKMVSEGLDWIPVYHIKDLPPAHSEEDCDTCKHGYFGDDQCNNCRVRYPSHYERRAK